MKKVLPYLIGFVCGWLIFTFLAKSQFNADAVAQTVLTPQEEKAIRSQQKILREIMELYATQALEPPKDLAVCAQELFAMRRNGKCRDKFSRYLSPQDAKRAREDFAGKFGGVGVVIVPKGGQVVIKELMPGAPAEQAGIKPGDIIVKVGDKKPADMQEAADLMRGKPGTKVTVAVLRGKDQKELVFTLTREIIIAPPAVKWNIAPGNKKIAVITISAFDINVPDEFYDVLHDLVNHQVHGIIIDLRDNPGGFLKSATNFLMYFRGNGDRLLTIRERDGQRVFGGKDTPASGLALMVEDYKVLVLINKNSTSASEIVAGTMKDWGYTVVGEKSYGKGVGQIMFPLSGGGELWLTTFEFLVGNRKTPIRDIGVLPTTEVKIPERCVKVCGDQKSVIGDEDNKKDIQLEKAVEVLDACIKRNSESKNCDPVIKKK